MDKREICYLLMCFPDSCLAGVRRGQCRSRSQARNCHVGGREPGAGGVQWQDAGVDGETDGRALPCGMYIRSGALTPCQVPAPLNTLQPAFSSKHSVSSGYQRYDFKNILNLFLLFCFIVILSFILSHR